MYAPGHELDALVAEQVMGWTVHKPERGHWWAQVGPTVRQIAHRDYTGHVGAAFHPSRDMRHAIEAVCHVGGFFILSHFVPGGWKAASNDAGAVPVQLIEGKNAPEHATCVALLAYVRSGAAAEAHG